MSGCNQIDDEDDYNYFSTQHGCMSCHQKPEPINLIYTELEWDVRPRIKDYERGYERYQDILGLYLCHHCYLNCKVVKTIGWDKWDASDCLSKIPTNTSKSFMIVSKL